MKCMLLDLDCAPLLLLEDEGEADKPLLELPLLLLRRAATDMRPCPSPPAKRQMDLLVLCLVSRPLAAITSCSAMALVWVYESRKYLG